MNVSPLAGKTFVFAGAFVQKTRREATEDLLALGARVTGSVTGKTDVLVSTMDGGNSVHKARLHGIPILSEEEFQQLLDGRSLEDITTSHLDETTGVEDSKEVQFAAFRTALLQGPTCKAWSELIGLLDETPAEDLPLVVEYIESHMEDWDSELHENWITGYQGGDMEETREFWKHSPHEIWMSGMLPGEVRVAPYHWLESMFRGEDSPRWRLVRQLHLKGLKLKGKQVLQLLELPSLCNVTTLSLLYNKKLSATCFKNLRMAPSMSKLKTLAVGHLDQKQVLALQGESSFRLKRLGLEDNGEIHRDIMLQLFRSEMMKDLESLYITGVVPPVVMADCLVEDLSLLPHVVEFRQSPYAFAESLRTLHRSGLPARIRSFALGMHLFWEEEWQEGLEALRLEDFGSLEHLDVEAMHHGVVHRGFQEMTSSLVRYLSESRTFSRLKTIRLGKLKTEEFLQLCQTHDVEVVG